MFPKLWRSKRIGHEQNVGFSLNFRYFCYFLALVDPILKTHTIFGNLKAIQSQYNNSFFKILKYQFCRLAGTEIASFLKNRDLNFILFW